MDRRELDEIERFLTSVGRASLFEYYGVTADTPADDLEGALKKRRAWAQGQQSNPKFKNEALFIIKNNATIRRILLEETDAYRAHVEDDDALRGLDILSRVIRGSLSDGVLRAEDEAAILHQGRQLEIAPAVVAQCIEDVLRETGARRQAGQDAGRFASSVDYYELLNVPEGASESDLESAYRARYRWARTLMDKEKATQILEMLDEAWRVLKDPAGREQYDAHRATVREMTDEVEKRAATLLGLLGCPTDPDGQPAEAAVPLPDWAGPVVPPSPPPLQMPPPASAAPAPESAETAPVPVAIQGRTLGIAAGPQNVRTRGPKLQVDSPDVVQLSLARKPIRHTLQIRNSGQGRMPGRVTSDRDWVDVSSSRLQEGLSSQTITLLLAPDRVPWGRSAATVTVVTDHGERRSITLQVHRSAALRVVFGAVSGVLLIAGLAFTVATWLWEPKARPAAPLVLSVDPPADVFLIDGEPVGSGRRLEVKEPKFDAPFLVRIESSGFEPHEEFVTLQKGQELERHIVLPLADSMTWTPPVGTLPSVAPEGAVAAIESQRSMLRSCFKDLEMPAAEASYAAWATNDGNIRRVDVTDANFNAGPAMPCIRRVFRATRVPSFNGFYARIETRLSVAMAGP